MKGSLKKEEQVRSPGVQEKWGAQLNRKAAEQRQGRLGWPPQWAEEHKAVSQ